MMVVNTEVRKDVANYVHVLNYCISGDLQSLSACAADDLEVVHKRFLDGQTCLIAACRNGNAAV